MAYAGLIISIKNELQDCRELMDKTIDSVDSWYTEDELEHQAVTIGNWIPCLPDTHNVHQLMQDRLDYLAAVRGMMCVEEARLLAIVDMDQLTEHTSFIMTLLERLEKGDA